MADNTHITLPQPPAIATPEQIYDVLMGPIEPELTTAMLPLLAEKYKDETPEDKKIRGERYKKAFAQYKKQAAVCMNDMRNAARTFQREAMHGVESIASAEEQSHMDSLESSLASL